MIFDSTAIKDDKVEQYLSPLMIFLSKSNKRTIVTVRYISFDEVIGIFGGTFNVIFFIFQALFSFGQDYVLQASILNSAFSFVQPNTDLPKQNDNKIKKMAIIEDNDQVLSINKKSKSSSPKNNIRVNEITQFQNNKIQFLNIKESSNKQSSNKNMSSQRKINNYIENNHDNHLRSKSINSNQQPLKNNNLEFISYKPRINELFTCFLCPYKKINKLGMFKRKMFSKAQTLVDLNLSAENIVKNGLDLQIIKDHLNMLNQNEFPNEKPQEIRFPKLNIQSQLARDIIDNAIEKINQ